MNIQSWQSRTARFVSLGLVLLAVGGWWAGRGSGSRPVWAAAPDASRGLLRTPPVQPTLEPTATLTPLGFVATPTPPPQNAAPTLQPTPIGGRAVSPAGGAFTCAQWGVRLPGQAAPNGGTLHCGAFDPNVAPPAPAGFRLLSRTINVVLYNEWGAALVNFSAPLQFCLAYSDSDLAAAGGLPANLVIQTASVGGAWNALATSALPASRQVCASATHLSLFDLSVRAAGSASAYHVQWGDTLFSISQRFNTTVAGLMAANGLSDILIYPGQALSIPSGPVAVPPAVVNPPAAAPVAAGRYVVQLGDTLFSIAWRAGVALADLRAANNAWSNTIYPGQELVIPSGGAPAASAPPAATALPPAAGARIYVIQPGDTLFSIAQKYGQTWQALLSANGLWSTLIYPGQQLIIP